MVRSWPQTPDSQFYGLRTELIYHVLGMQNYPQVMMTVEDYPAVGGEYDAVDFEQSWIHDPWFAAASTQIGHAWESVMDVHLYPDEHRIDARRCYRPVASWTMHMDHPIRTAIRHCEYAVGTRDVH